MSAEDQKRAVGEAAAALVETGMTVGLGTGSTAVHMLRAVARRAAAERLDLLCVATSEATAALAQANGLRLIALDEAGPIDLTLDGADEIGPGLALIKGRGAALLREKLVWEASRRCVVLADGSKLVHRLGRFPLPVEVVAFGHATTARRIAAVTSTMGMASQPMLRLHDGQVVMTDGGNVIYDVACGEIADAAGLASRLKAVTGVVEHGLFLDLAQTALIATDEGVRQLQG